MITAATNENIRTRRKPKRNDKQTKKIVALQNLFRYLGNRISDYWVLPYWSLAGNRDECILYIYIYIIIIIIIIIIIYIKVYSSVGQINDSDTGCPIILSYYYLGP